MGASSAQLSTKFATVSSLFSGWAFTLPCAVAEWPQLIKELERIARKSACETLALYTVRETGNVKIFDRMGFVVKSEEPSRLFESDRYKLLTEVFMSKNVNALKVDYPVR